ncbi:chromosomal replication initiator protein DnaA [Actinocatenispora thailandica]|uniref:Chromosomal replication initiator protein DnaA n=1 Tax=Actinocatenispora thailandica TaxID=227318 RepID=A0A7R7DW71_9ACTN|nr:chromosomal replication initiator protein DnaA [Actinocatenispora thailandica]BCJ38874.1 chromosomal replication initiator protein DnaA [Actinocatenispora thailandica]
MGDDAVNLAAVWVAATEELANETLSPQQQAWLRLTRPLALVEDTAFIAAPNPFTRDAIESRLRPAITEALSRRLGRTIQLAVAVQPSDDPDQVAGDPGATLPPTAPDFRAAAPDYRGPASDYPPAPPDYRPDGSDYRPEGVEFRPEPAEYRPESNDFAPDRRGYQSDGPDYRPDAPDYRPDAAGYRHDGRDYPADTRDYRPIPGGYRPTPGDYPPPAQDRTEPDDYRRATEPDGQLPLGIPAPQLPGLDIPTASRAASPPRRTAPTVTGPAGAPPQRAGDDPGAEPVRPPAAARPDRGHRLGSEGTGRGDSASPVRPGGQLRDYTGRGADAVSRLNPKYTFETFVIGSSNRFAHAAAIAVAESPAKAYNPLFVYGGSGLGKTHLLHAIGHYAASLGNARSVRYVSTEEFTNDFINSLRDDKMQAFQRRYRDADILLIDDIQFLERAERTQEEFFHTFNTLHNANKQIVITSDRSPKQLSTLEDRLRTRFEWGLLADIQPPDLETRIAILQKKAAHERLYAPLDVLEFIASRIQNSIRELEGALIRVTAFASLNRAAVDLGLAEEVLRDLIPDGAGPEINSEQIMELTCDYFGVSIDDLRGHSRSRVLVNARQVAMYLCRELTDLSLPRIGQAFGGRDHTTVMHADRKIRRQMAERRTLYNQIAELTNRIKQQEP